MKRRVAERGRSYDRVRRGSVGVARGDGDRQRGTSGEEGVSSFFIGNKDSLTKQVPGRVLSTLHALTHFALTTQ